VKRIRLGPGSLESVTLHMWTRRRVLAAEARGWYTVHCGSGNTHVVSIRSRADTHLDSDSAVRDDIQEQIISAWGGDPDAGGAASSTGCLAATGASPAAVRRKRQSARCGEDGMPDLMLVPGTAGAAGGAAPDLGTHADPVYGTGAEAVFGRIEASAAGEG
jgi:hypothetical protein